MVRSDREEQCANGVKRQPGGHLKMK